MTDRKTNAKRGFVVSESFKSRRRSALVVGALAVAILAGFVLFYLPASSEKDRPSASEDGPPSSERASGSVLARWAQTPKPEGGMLQSPAEAAALGKSIAELVEFEVAEKLEHGGPWEPQDLPLVGESLVQIEGFIRDHASEWSQGGSLEVQRQYMKLQRIHNELLLQTGILPEASEEGLRRGHDYLAAKQAMEARMSGLSADERAARQQELKASIMRQRSSSNIEVDTSTQRGGR